MQWHSLVLGLVMYIFTSRQVCGMRTRKESKFQIPYKVAMVRTNVPIFGYLAIVAKMIRTLAEIAVIWLKVTKAYS